MEMKEEIKNMKLHGEDLQQFEVFSDHHQVMREAMKDDDEIWFEAVSHHQQHENNKNDSTNNSINDENGGNNNGGILDVMSDPSSLFYADFPLLPDFSCMSSSSSSSSIPAVVVKPFGVSSSATSSSTSTASSGAASWAGLKSDADHDPDPSSSVDMMPPPPSGQNQEGGSGDGGGGVGMVLDDVDHCMNMMENFGCIDLLESADICWDPSPLFEDNGDDQFLQQSELLENHLGEDNDEDMVFEQFMQQHQHQDCGDGSITISGNNNNLNSSGVINAALGGQSSGDVGGINQLGSDSSADDLAMVFFEWLKSNKEAISAEDLRNIKIKKSTIENAAKRLGGGREGMKQLLKLILQWVQNHHLQNKRAAEDDIEGVSATGCGGGGGGGGGSGGVKPYSRSYSIEERTKNNNDNNSSSNNVTPATPSDNISGGNPNGLIEQQCFSPTTWLPTPPLPPPYVNETVGMVHMPVPPHPPPGFLPSVGYNLGGDPHSGSNPMAAYPPPPIPPSDYHSWGPTPMQYGMGPQYGSYSDVAQYGEYGNPPPAYPGYYYHPGPGEGLVRLGSSATKEARKKRMARQRRFFTHHHRNSQHNNNNHQNHNGGGVSHQQMISQMAEQHAVVGNGTCAVAPGGNWVYWPPRPPAQVMPSHQMNHSGAMVGQMMPPQPPMERPNNGFQKQVGTEKKQGWKTEKNLRFLLQKVLKQSDVGNLGRIVLPKKEAETHLPELEARDGIPIAMEDIGTCRVWNMRYRFWPNNKSRMYLLENTGDFVRSNGLQEGDFIVIYSDVKCGKYMIRGVKVRAQQQGTKPETPNKKPNKAQRLDGCSSPAATPNMMQS